MRILTLAAIAALNFLIVASTLSAAGPTVVTFSKESQGKTLKQLRDMIAKLPKPDQVKAIASIKIDRRIIGGNAVDISDFKWQVALIRGYAPEPMRSQFCGGTLIAADIVLTAAHCVDNNIVRKEANRIDIVAGTAFYASGGERIHVDAIFIHPQWNANTNDYDFAILKLSSKSVMGAPIPLQAQAPVVGSLAEVSGWGALSEGGTSSPDLLAAQLPIVSLDECNKKDSYNGELTSEMLCAGMRDGGIDSCQGDSGGPLVSVATRKLIGVVSFGEGCARSLKYGVYAQVSSAIPWIRSFNASHVVLADGRADGAQFALSNR